jgi:AcrR family transcriptional regulator
MTPHADDVKRRVGRPPGPAPDPAVRRAELLAAAERVVRERGPDVGMDDIAAEVGLTKPAVYRWLGDKGQLTAALGEVVAARLVEQLADAFGRGGEPRELTRSAIDVFCRFVEEDTNLYRFVVHGPAGAPRTRLRDRPLVTSIAALIGDTLRTALERAGAPAHLADTWSHAILGAVFAATEHWLAEGETPRAELVDDLVRLIVPAFDRIGIQGPPDSSLDS